MNAARIGVLLVGVAILVANAVAVIAVLIVPRSSGKWAALPMRAVRGLFRKLALLARSYIGMDRILAMSEPVALVVLLGSWLVVTVLGFTLVNWGIDGSGQTYIGE